MSVVVDLSALAEHLEGFGRVAYLVTAGEAGLPHIVSVRPQLSSGRVVVGAGRRTLANATARPAVTLLWPAPPGEGYALILDGEAEPRRDEAGASLEIRPSGAVLHRTPEGDPGAPSCVTVIDGTG